MTRQPLALVGEVMTCAWCAAGIRDNEIAHKDDCRWVDDMRAAERTRLFVAIRHALPLDAPWRGPALDVIFPLISEVVHLDSDPRGTREQP